jgi:hypothetical protein
MAARSNYSRIGVASSSSADVREMRCQEQASAAAGDATADNGSVAAAEASLSTLQLEPSTPAEAAVAANNPSAAANNPSAAAAASQADSLPPPAKAAAALSVDGPAAAAAAAVEPGAAATDGSSSVFAVAAGSFQCVWFFSLRERHHKPVIEWVQQQLEQQQQQQGGEAAGDVPAGAAYCLAATTKDIPQVGNMVGMDAVARPMHRKCAGLEQPNYSTLAASLFAGYPRA